jgi:lambda family phage portal protein
VAARRSLLAAAFDLFDEVAMPALARAGQLADGAVGLIAPGLALQRHLDRHRLDTLAAMRGYEGAEPSRKRKFSRDTRNGDALARRDAVALRNQARHLDRNVDFVRGGLDKLVDFVVGPKGISVEPQPKRADGSIHQEFAAQLQREYEEFRKWPEVTWTHDGGSSDRLVARTWFRDGECLGQLVSGRRNDITYGSEIPVATELIEPDLLPHWKDDSEKNIAQGIQRNEWGRPTQYHFLKQHPGSDRVSLQMDTKAVPAERVLHLRSVDRIGQLRGITMLASVIPRAHDIAETDSFERIAAKMASSLVLKINRGSPDIWGAGGDQKYDPEKPPVYQMDGGMIVFNGQPGEDCEFFDTKRPNGSLPGYFEQQMRWASAGFGLSYSALSRNYNGTYSAQRQELVENWPHYHALTGQFIAQWTQPTYEEFVRWRVLTKGLPPGVVPESANDALFFGPAMPWIDPEKEANAQLILVQACFKSSSQVMRERGQQLVGTYQQIKVEKELRQSMGITSSVDVNPDSVAPAQPSAPEPQTKPGTKARASRRRRAPEAAAA